MVLTMITASLLHKLAPFYSLGRWLVTKGLHRYLPPTDKLLRPHVSMPAPTTKKKAASQRAKVLSSRKSSPEEIIAALNTDPSSLDQSLAVPKSANIELEETEVKWLDVDQLHYSGELEFLLNFTMAVLVIFACTSVYYYLKPTAAATEYNLAVIWVLMVILYAYKLLFSLTRVYLSEELAHQRSLCMVFTLLFFVCALVVLLVDESYLNFGLEKSHRDLCRSVSVVLGGFLRNRSIKPSHLLPMWLYKIVLALLASMLSMTLIFPGFRFADTHFSTIRYAKTPIFKTLLHANYIAPMFCLSLWIQPLTEGVVKERNVTVVFGVPLSYNNVRVVALVSVCLLRLILLRTYLQSHLNSAKWKLESQRAEQGRVAIYTLRKNVSNIFLFYSALGIQYMAPYIILLSLALLFNISSTTSDYFSKLSSSESGSSGPSILHQSGWGISSFHGCIAFFCWWVCFSNAITSGFGAVLKEYL